MTWLKRYSPQISSVVLALLVWEVVSRVIDSSGLPPASEVLGQLADYVASGRAWEPLGSTLLRTALGFLLGFVVGTGYGVLVFVSGIFDDLSRWVFRIAMFAPTLVLIFLSLVMIGRTNLTVILLVGAVISTDVGVYIRDAMRDFDRDLVSMADSYKATTRQRFTGLYLPFLIPPMLAAGRIGFSLSWKVAFLAEVFGFSEGLGWQVRTSYTIYDMTSLLAWLTLFVATMLVIEQLTRVTERAVVKW